MKWYMKHNINSNVDEKYNKVTYICKVWLHYILENGMYVSITLKCKVSYLLRHNLSTKTLVDTFWLITQGD